MVFANVIDEFLGVIGSWLRREDYAVYAFFQCGPQCVDDCFVKTVRYFRVFSRSFYADGVFGFSDFAEDFPEDCLVFF